MMSSGSEIIELFFMLSSVEHETCPANKSQIAKTCKFSLVKHG